MQVKNCYLCGGDFAVSVVGISFCFLIELSSCL